jgi:fatty-acyl-CoA synthase
VTIMTRWDKRCAALLIERHRVWSWTAIPTMLFDFLNQDLSGFDLSSLTLLTGGGAAMPKAVAERIRELWGIDYVEGYGLSETMAPTHLNPRQRPKAQCLGLPIFDTEAYVVDPATLAPLAQGEVGEIIVRGPQVFLGYHNNARADKAAFVEFQGQRYFRTGDLGYIDEDGYYFMVDRLKRMINASGYKVWPAEVETFLYRHPAVLEACVIGYRDPHRGESVKAIVVLRPGHKLEPGELIAWAREHMAAYKVPHAVEFRDSLPRSATGKVQWRLLQEAEAGT